MYTCYVCTYACMFLCMYVSMYALMSERTYVCLQQGKAIPLQAWTGPEGSRRLRLPDFKTIGT